MIQLRKMLRDCIACRKKCVDIERDQRAGIYPRGFFYDFPYPATEVLVVSHCPGRTNSRETRIVRQMIQNGKEPLSAVLLAAKEALFGPEAIAGDIKFGGMWEGNPFHARLWRFLCEIVDCERIELQNHVSFTNVVKCQRKQDCGVPLAEAEEKCTTHYLSKEIELVAPKVIVANGRDAERMVKRVLIKTEIDIHVEWIPHTSQRNARFWHNDWAPRSPQNRDGSPRYKAIDRIRECLHGGGSSNPSRSQMCKQEASVIRPRGREETQIVSHSEALKFILQEWEQVGGSCERKRGPGYKLLRESGDHYGAMFVETYDDRQTLRRFYCLRMKSEEDWQHFVRSDVGISSAFDLDVAPKGFIRAYPKSYDKDLLERFLKLCMQRQD